MNNFNCNRDGVSVDLDISYDQYLAQHYFKENLERIKEDLYFYKDFGNLENNNLNIELTKKQEIEILCNEYHKILKGPTLSLPKDFVESDEYITIKECISSKNKAIRELQQHLIATKISFYALKFNNK